MRRRGNRRPPVSMPSHHFGCILIHFPSHLCRWRKSYYYPYRHHRRHHHQRPPHLHPSLPLRACCCTDDQDHADDVDAPFGPLRILFDAAAHIHSPSSSNNRKASLPCNFASSHDILYIHGRKKQQAGKKPMKEAVGAAAKNASWCGCW